MPKFNLLKTVSLLIFLVLSVQLFSQNLAVSLIPEQLKKNVNSVLRYDNTTIEISKSYDMTITSEWAVTVLNSSGNEHVYAGS
jgi:quinolinate synthase